MFLSYFTSLNWVAFIIYSSVNWVASICFFLFQLGCFHLFLPLSTRLLPFISSRLYLVVTAHPHPTPPPQAPSTWWWCARRTAPTSLRPSTSGSARWASSGAGKKSWVPARDVFHVQCHVPLDVFHDSLVYPVTCSMTVSCSPWRVPWQSHVPRDMFHDSLTCSMTVSCTP